MNINKLTYPSGKGLAWSVDINIAEDFSVTIPAFDISVNGATHKMSGSTFTLNDGDTVYMTAMGLVVENGNEGAIPVEKESFQETGSCYWLVSRSGDVVLILEVQNNDHN